MCTKGPASAVSTRLVDSCFSSIHGEDHGSFCTQHARKVNAALTIPRNSTLQQWSLSRQNKLYRDLLANRQIFRVSTFRTGIDFGIYAFIVLPSTRTLKIDCVAETRRLLPEPFSSYGYFFLERHHAYSPSIPN